MIKNKRLLSYWKEINNWLNKRLINLVLFNFFVIVLILFHSAGYFAPFFFVTINLIIVLSFIGSIFLLGARSRELFLISFGLWLFTIFSRLLGVGFWAEKSAISAFQALVLGLILLVYELLIEIRSK